MFEVGDVVYVENIKVSERNGSSPAQKRKDVQEIKQDLRN